MILGKHINLAELAEAVNGKHDDMSAPTTEYGLSTEEFAAINLVKAQTVRARLSRVGSYFGVRPAKLANGRTAWPHVQVRGDIVGQAT